MSLGGGASGQSSSQQQQNEFNQVTRGDQSGQYVNGPTNSGQLQGALNSAQALYGNGNNTTNAGYANINAGVNAAGGLFGQGNQAVGNTLNGSYLSAGNPYFGNMVSQLGDAIRPQIDGQFAAAGRYGSGAAANAYGSALANQAGQLAYQNYGAERGNQVATANNLPSYTAGLTQPGQTQLTAGYTPINQYIQQLSTLKPGTAGAYGSTNSGSASGSGNSSGSGNQAKGGFTANAKAGE